MATDKTLAELEGAVLGIDTCLQLYEKLKFEGQRLEGTWHAYDAFNFLVTARHLSEDWIPRDRANRPALATQKIQRNNLPIEAWFLLEVIRDLSNGSKHLSLRPKDAEKRVVAETHGGEISDFWAWFFQESMLGVTAYDTADTPFYFSIRVLRNLTLDYFSWVFDDSQPVKNFPGELLGKIWRCAPKNCDPKAVPPPGAIVGPLGDPDFVRTDF